MFQIDKN